MRIRKLSISNYRSFGPGGTDVEFHTGHTLFVGKNNAGKSNILSALNLLLGAKNPQYLRLSEDDFFDPIQPIRIELQMGPTGETDKQSLFSLPNLTKQQKGALGGKKPEELVIELSFEYTLDNEIESRGQVESQDEDERQTRKFVIKLWGFNVFKKVEEIRKVLTRMVLVPAIRQVSKELSGTQWTYYGQLMRSVLEDSDNFEKVKDSLNNINKDIQSIFSQEKQQLLEGARVVSFVEDVNFQLTKEGNPIELLRNLEVFISEKGKLINIQNMGTGTQSAIIIGILELALRYKSSRLRLFLIEEPEIFVHPHGIRYLGDLLRKTALNENTQVVVSTHSPVLASTFSPQEIIRVAKTEGKTTIHQPKRDQLTDLHFKRMVNAENAEMFFSDGVILVEGDTEKHLFPVLGKRTALQPEQPDTGFCDFDKVNIAVVRLNGMENLLNYIEILDAFEIRFAAILDKDFVGSRQFQKTCERYAIDHSDRSKATKALKKVNIFINSKGETEDLVPDDDLIDILFIYELEQNPEIPDEKKSALRKSISEKIAQTKANHPDKTSKAFEGLFNAGKSTYAIRLSEFYSSRDSHPFEGLLRYLYKVAIAEQAV